ncbi:MAG: dihydrodipicolinate synthase family protein [Gemmatimonadaceae bacterium]
MEGSEHARPAMLSTRAHLREGQVIPAHPLALAANRTLDERRQRGLTRYYVRSGAGGIAVGVHTTQFAIRDSSFGLYRPVLEMAVDEARAALADAPRPFGLIAGVCGHTAQASTEAEIAAALGYDAALLSLGDWRTEPEAQLLEHCRVIGEIMPLFGFYLQPAVGGRVLSHNFWREFVEIPAVWAIKIAPFNRYQTIDVIRAVTEAGRDDIALYTGNDDNIVADLLTPFPIHVGGETVVRWIDGGLLGQWAMWTERAVAMLAAVKVARDSGSVDPSFLAYGAALTDANGAIFDAPNRFAGCIPGIHEVLRRQGLLDGVWCLNENEELSPGQNDEITRVMHALAESFGPL